MQQACKRTPMPKYDFNKENFTFIIGHCIDGSKRFLAEFQAIKYYFLDPPCFLPKLYSRKLPSGKKYIH